jgi:hypothetical protein
VVYGLKKDTKTEREGSSKKWKIRLDISLVGRKEK